MENLVEIAVQNGAKNAGIVEVSKIPFRAELRKACEDNYCGNYGKNWTCPPGVGDIEALIARAKEYRTALVYQTVWNIEDSFDFEGMMAAAEGHYNIAQKITNAVKNNANCEFLHLLAGGCRVCEICGQKTGEPCRYPDKAIASLESYGIFVSELAGLCGMNYINGQNTVTYFGAYLFK